MTERNNLRTQPSQPVSLAKPILIGAAIGLILISWFLLSAGKGNPSWPKFWIIRPLIIVPLAGATGGAFYYFMNHLSLQRRLNKFVAVILSLIVFIIGLWLGTVLGLDGTYWN